MSDSQYFEDLGGSLSISSITHLDRSVAVSIITPTRMSFFGQVQDFQTMDEAICPIRRALPARRSCSSAAAGRDRWLGTSQLGVDGELVNFDRDVGVTGWRLNVIAPSIEMPIVARPGWFINAGRDRSITPDTISKDDTGCRDENDRKPSAHAADRQPRYRAWSSNANYAANGSQRIEPDDRAAPAVRTHMPFREPGSDLPVFDTITPDLNLVSAVPHAIVFLALTASPTADQISVGVTSRILDVLEPDANSSRRQSDRRVT